MEHAVKAPKIRYVFMLREVPLPFFESVVWFFCVHPRKMPLSLFEIRMTPNVIGNEIKCVIPLQDTKK